MKVREPNRSLEGLRIAFIAGTLGQGGAERQLVYIAGALVKAGARVRVLCLTRNEFWEPELARMGTPVQWVGQRPWRWWRALRIAAELRSERPDVVQSQHFYTNLYAATAARAIGAHEIGAIRNDVVSEVRANGFLLGRMSLRWPRMLAANSAAAIRTAVALGVPPDRLALLPNVVDTSHFFPGSPSGGRTVRLLAAGRLVPQKRMDRFLSLVATLRRNGEPVRGVIAGDGPLMGELRASAAGLGLSADAIEFRGVVPDLAPLYREADIFVLSSDHEGTPNVVLEAMSAGLPVIASRVGGVEDLIRDGETGLLAPTGDGPALLQAAAKLTRSSEARRRIGACARAFVEARHSPAALQLHLCRLYGRALARTDSQKRGVQ
jgi:glycosyltransferase involved in cell wall biosynthesis